MAHSFSQQDYLALVEQSYYDSMAATPFDHFHDDALATWPLPKQLGQGQFCKIDICNGLVLDIFDYALDDEVTIVSRDRDHPLELSFVLLGAAASNLSTVQAGQHAFYGSGMAPGAIHRQAAHQRKLEVSIHIEPHLLGQWTTACADAFPQSLQHLVKPSDQIFYSQVSTTPAVMQQAIRQLLGCPFQGLTQRMYLESKVWELIALQLAQLPTLEAVSSTPKPLKPEDIERIHYAKDVLVARLSAPPTLIELARLVGINDCKLKAGFRQVFGTTVFGYLHNCRMEKAKTTSYSGRNDRR
ncbi:helix-turn-helix transcriptional regulator [bacterium]|nr:helix-turn-helix transcriptional regulator [bacterium]